MATQYHFTIEQKQEVLNLYNIGLSARKVAGNLHYSHHHVIRMLKELGVEFRTKFTEEEKKRIVEMYDNGISGLEIADKYKHGKNHVYRILKEAGINLEYNRNKFSPEVEKQIVQEYNDSDSMKELGRRHNCHAATIFNILKRHKVKTRGRGNKKYFSTQQKINVVKLLLREGLSEFKIAEIMKISQSTVSNFLRRNNIPSAKVVASRENHGNWKGGRINLNGYTYVKVYQENKFFSMVNCSGYVAEHRYVMAQHLGRVLRDDESVHHIDGDIQNNKIENLQLRVNNHGAGQVACCSDCGSKNIIFEEIA